MSWKSYLKSLFKAALIVSVGLIALLPSSNHASAISFKSASAANNSVASTIIITVPSGTIAGDVLIASLDVENSPSITPPAGWNLIRSDTNPNGLHMVQADYFHVVGSNEPLTYTWTFSAPHGSSGGMIDYSGVDNINPVDTTSGAVTGTTATKITAPSVITSTANSLLVDVTGIGVNRTLTPPSGMTPEYTNSTTASGEKTQILVSDQVLPLAGSTGSRTVTSDLAAVGIGQLIALKPMSTDTTAPSTPNAFNQISSSTSSISTSWAASTDNVAVTGYTLYLNGSVQSTVQNTNFTFNNLVCGTSYNMSVDAYDATGNHSQPAYLTGNTAPCAVIPMVAISSPADGATVSGTQVPININASDSNGIASVQFYVDGNPIGSPVTIAPYTVSWDTTSVADGQHTLTASAIDNSGNTATSTPISVSVANITGNAPPTVNVYLSSSTPDTDATITATAVGSDANNDPISYQFVWLVNSTPVKTSSFSSLSTSFLDLSLPGNGNYGDTVTVEVTPNDGFQNGTTAQTSATVTKPATGTIIEYPLPVSGNPGGITVGPDGNFWVSVEQSQYIEVISPAGQVVKTVLLPSVGNLGGITSGPDGNIWAAELTANKIAKITTSGQITEYPVPTANGGFGGITTGSDGNLWFVEGQGNKIGRITTAGVISEFTVPTAKSFPHSIAKGPDGNTWFCELNVGKIGKITPGGTITEYRLPVSTAKPNVINFGPDGNMWFTEQTGKIGLITMSGIITEFKLSNSLALPVGITTGSDGNIWFTENKTGKIGRITPSGSITEFPVPISSSQPDKIVAGLDGNLWFTEHFSNKIARITP